MAHIHEKIDFCSNVYIVNGDAVLLRIHDKYKIWLPPGGHIELDEDPVQAAIREAKEEVGLDIELAGKLPGIQQEGGIDLLTPRFMRRHPIGETHEHVCLEYLARSKDRNVVQGESEISDHIKWFTKEDLENPEYALGPDVRYRAQTALKELGAVAGS